MEAVVFDADDVDSEGSGVSWTLRDVCLEGVHLRSQTYREGDSDPWEESWNVLGACTDPGPHVRRTQETALLPVEAYLLVRRFLLTGEHGTFRTKGGAPADRMM